LAFKLTFKIEIVRDKHLLVVSDSQYAIKGATEWMENWKKNGWVNSKKKPVENKDLWLKLDLLLHGCDGTCKIVCSKKCNNINRNVKFQWVRGHNTDVGNIEADRLAVEGINKK
jgi:ribonuclease HI